MPGQRNLQKEKIASEWIQNSENFELLTPATQSAAKYVLSHLKDEDPWGEATKHYSTLPFSGGRPSKNSTITRSGLINRVLSCKQTQESKRKNGRKTGGRRIGSIGLLPPVHSHLTIRLGKQNVAGFLTCLAVHRLEKTHPDRMEFGPTNLTKVFLSLEAIVNLTAAKKGCWIHLTNAEYFCQDSKTAVKAAMRQAPT